MTHREFILVANQDIKEFSRGIEVVSIAKGSSITVTEEVFNKLQKNETIKIYTREGILEYDKYMFENEVNYTAVTIEYGTRKLGQRKNKL
jgi:predicted ThiF/HesA family dinucleotide-utilizing enzyme